MTDNRNTILAVILSGLVLLGWQYFFNIPQMEKQRAQSQLQSELAKPAQFIGYQGDESAPSAVLLKHNGLHFEIQIDANDSIGKTDAAGVSDVVLA